MGQFRVRFYPDGIEASVQAGTTLLEAAAVAHVAIDAPCGDRGICGKCKVRAVANQPSAEQLSAISSQQSALSRPDSSLVPPDSSLITHHSSLAPVLEPPTLPERSVISVEELKEGWRLACQARVAGDVTVQVPERALKPAVVPLSQIDPRPAVRKVHLSLPEPTVEDAMADLARLRRGLAQTEPRTGQSGNGDATSLVDLELLQLLPGALSSAGYDVTAVLAGDRLIGVERGDTTPKRYGLAVDLGTTSVVAILADLSNGKVLGVESRLNGQANHGADVVSRITYVISEAGGLRKLQSAAVTTINTALDSLLASSGVPREQVYEVVLVGNSCMNHLLLGIDPRSLASAPYQPAITDPVVCRAAELGISISPGGLLYTLPNIAGFVGSDTVAVILATEMHRAEEIRLAIDLGTNGEMVLGNRHRLLACSTAAGPAFEGARISCGMRATGGAIERVWIDGETVRLQVIDAMPALGICGSGLLDAVAQMRHAGLVNESGRLLPQDQLPSSVPGRLAQRRVKTDQSDGFLLARRGRRSVVLTQGDVRELQLAKGAIRAGVTIMLKEYGIGESEITEILLAGAFGSYVNPASARELGLVPPLPIDRITAVGNAAGQGAVMALVSTEMREEANQIAASVEHLELSARPDFMDCFMDSLTLRGA